jgi:predicted nuclease of predicted toxin-antitoxin system
MVRLYANENFPLPVVQKLRNFGYDILTVREAGNADQAIPDDEVLAFAVAESRIVLTLNRRDFIHLHKSQPNHAGIIVCTYDADFIGQAQQIHEAIKAKSTLDGQLLRVNRPVL